MKLRAEQLAGHLQNGLRPIYLLSGDEPLQMMEAGDAIRQQARQQGVNEREVLHAAATGFDWNTLSAAANTLSLFAEQRLIELHLPTGKPGNEGSKALCEYAARPPEDTVLLVLSGKLDKAAQNSKWAKALDQAGVTIQCWPIKPEELPAWVGRRMQGCGLHAANDATVLLAERVEGNMLAAAQEVEKLLLLYGPGQLTLEQVEEGVANSARYNVFELVDTALAGDAVRSTRILQGLYGEGLEPVLILWALLREIRSLCTMAEQLEQGQPLSQILTAQRVWDNRKAVVTAALKRHRARTWQSLLRMGGRIDRIVKGAEPGNARDELQQLALLIAGVRLV